jgi:protein-S-isoprenylcysteine O-methyltransferase Ste14
MSDKIITAMNIAWLILISFWIISGIKAKKSAFKESYFQQFILYWLPLLLTVWLLGPDERPLNSLIRGSFFPNTNLEGYIGLIFSFSGLVTCCISRFMLGNNWSVSVQRKEDHELVRKGPYKFIRHPIYSGLLMMFLGNAIIVGRWRGLIGVSILFISFWFKLKKEEKWLSESFGKEYIDYMSQTAALIPWIF